VERYESRIEYLTKQIKLYNKSSQKTSKPIKPKQIVENEFYNELKSSIQKLNKIEKISNLREPEKLYFFY